ncbi:MAG: baseplate J/gp47 family protein [Rhizobiales bacterium]|nr:baseplate J/gp47 family protein [Hyphomicrobiales bacterium]NRB13113.1 baseplate J/gp47 family protein [Hyphomicrobiales bacterium]
MSYNLPDLRKLMQRIKDNFRAEMPGTDVDAYPNNIAVIAKVIGGAVWELYSYLNDLKAQLFVSTATWALDLHGQERPIEARKDGEPDEQFRFRIQQSDKNTPEGGNEADYVKWALNYAGVTRAYVQRNGYGLGSVIVWPILDDNGNNGIPSPADCLAIKTHIEIDAPLLGAVYVEAATPQIINFRITDLSPNTVAAQTEITQELEAYFKTISHVTTTEDVLEIYQSNFDEIISAATLEIHHTLLEPLGTTIFPAATIPVLGSVTFE